ncbi:MAG: MerR family transcriptional regulator [Pseudomonadota bacterium]
MTKSADAFRTISEAAQEVDVPQHVLRHWEEVFGQIRPMRRAGGRRYYRPIDLDLLRGVRVLLYDERYTTKGVQKIFKENGVKYVAELGRMAAAGLPVELRPPLDEEDDSIQGAQPSAETPTATQSSPKPSVELAGRLRAVAGRLATAKASLDETMRALDALAEDGAPPSD